MNGLVLRLPEEKNREILLLEKCLSHELEVLATEGDADKQLRYKAILEDENSKTDIKLMATALYLTKLGEEVKIFTNDSDFFYLLDAVERLIHKGEGYIPNEKIEKIVLTVYNKYRGLEISLEAEKVTKEQETNRCTQIL